MSWEGSAGFLGPKNFMAKYQNTAIRTIPANDCPKPACCCCGACRPGLPAAAAATIGRPSGSAIVARRGNPIQPQRATEPAGEGKGNRKQAIGLLCYR
ncbi:hypothetical protein GW17_00003820 [Ensete ventricosum]|nr:hypothetical protein GW17_00003820 [Ensete ventricosum]